MDNLSHKGMSHEHTETERKSDQPKIPGIDTPSDQPRKPTDPSNQPVA
ncbi:MAG TPA: hypothetical protein VHA13_05215 [Gammaproteobacteria bacterium]|nr:hypothetical protein [Gammaproteobacteria bacterium]